MQRSNDSMEEWRPIIDYPEYEVSNGGSVRRGGRVLKPGQGKGYLYVALCRNGVQCSKTIHRLVASAFIPNPENKCDVDHINRVRTDNRIENLRWATRSENMINVPTRAEHRHIHINQNLYQVDIVRNYKHVFNKSYKTLAEAITSRDAFLLTPGNENVPGEL
jgi:hypothetical protein